MTSVKENIQGDVLTFFLNHVFYTPLPNNLNAEIYLDLSFFELYLSSFLKKTNLTLKKKSWVVKIGFGTLPSVHSGYFDHLSVSYSLVDSKSWFGRWEISNKIQVSLNKIWFNHTKSFFLNRKKDQHMSRVSIRSRTIEEGLLLFNSYKNQDDKRVLISRKSLSREELLTLWDQEETFFLND